MENVCGKAQNNKDRFDTPSIVQTLFLMPDMFAAQLVVPVPVPVIY